MSKTAIVNILTLSRVPLIAIWMALAIAEAYRGGYALGLAGCFFGFLSGLTDFWDGSLARRWNVVSTFGKLADPLMDKIFYVIAFPTLVWICRRQDSQSVHSLVLLLFAVLYILRDLWVTFMRAVGSAYGAPVAAMWMGKVRTALSFPAAGWVYFYLLLNPLVESEIAVYWLWSCYAVEMFMSSLNVLSFYTYTKAYWPFVKKALANR